MNKKMIAPTLITVILVAYFAFFVYTCIYLEPPFWFSIALVALAICLAGICIYVYIERIKEIKRGVEDDLGNY